jgi:GrpB-like predicted nucleotidyltransferase (UPF0157 family)
MLSFKTLPSKPIKDMLSFKTLPSKPIKDMLSIYYYYNTLAKAERLFAE